MNSPSTANRERAVPPLGGFNLTALSLEVRRMLRNRRTLMFVLVFPSVFFFMFRQRGERAGRAEGEGSPAWVLISMAVYGAMVGTTAGGASVSVERSLGWSRQLRLTPLRPTAYVGMKVMTAMVLGLIAVSSSFAIGALSGVSMTPQTWLLAGIASWLCSLVFAAFGLFMGFLLPSENVMQFVGPLLALLAFFGGLFVPLRFMSTTMQSIAKFSPVYGVGIISRSPLVGGFTGTAVALVLGWTVAFGIGAMALFRRDTARV